MTFVRMTHDQVDGPAVVSERAAGAYAARGWQLEELVADPTPVDSGPRELKRPQKNDSTAAWRTYAVALPADQGRLSAAEAFALAREELVAKYADPAKPKPAPATKAPRKRASSKAAAQPEPLPAPTATAVTTTQES